LKKFSNHFYNYRPKLYSERSCINYTCPKLNNLIVNNDYFIGYEYSQNALNKDYTHKSLGLSWGSPFVKVNESPENELLLSVAHLKLSTTNIAIAYGNCSKLLIVQKKLRKLLKKLFRDKYKINYSGFIPSCLNGFHYFSVFLLFNVRTNTVFMSDAFIPINIPDAYHFSLIFSIGLFNIGENTYITSGEGDYNCSIMKFNTRSIIDSCVHNVLDSNYNISDVNFILQFINPSKNIILDESTDISKIYKDYFNKFCLDKLAQTEYNNSIAESYLKKSFADRFKNKYIKYKNKYLQLKCNLKK